MKSQFELKILHQHWINDDGKDDTNDLCSHGKVYLRIGKENLSDRESGSWTLSSTALYLMRTVNENYEIGDFASQLIPCCGHFFMADDKIDEYSIIMGCPNGIDWTIRHIENEQVKHITKKGEEVVITKKEYRNLVISFANEVERFYEVGNQKEMPKDKFQRKGYEVFWQEWKKLKTKLIQQN